MKNKNSNRVFILGCGRTCDSLDFLKDLKHEYTLGISRWLFVKDFDCDFYYVADTGKLLTLCKKYGGFDEFKTFMKSNKNTKWIRNWEQDTSILTANNFEFGKNTYYTSKKTKGYPKSKFIRCLADNRYYGKIFSHYEDLKQSNLFDSRFNQHTYSQIELLSSEKSNPHPRYCAINYSISLAYLLGFSECYLVNFDVTSEVDSNVAGAYSKYIMKYKDSCGLVPNRKKNKYNTFCGWNKSYLNSNNFKGMKIRRLVPDNQYKKEIELYKENSKKLKKLEMIKTIPYEKFMYEGPEFRSRR